MTQEQDRIQRKLRELIGDDRIRIVDASNATFIDDAGRERRSRSESEVRHFNQVRDRVFKPPLEDESSEIADVAVLLSCEKEDRYEYWITYLGNDRKDRFAYVGELPKKLQTEQYWAWESNQGGRFEFNPYRGATGGFGGGSTTPNNYDGAVIEAGPSGAFYQSESWTSNQAKGGVVTPRWSYVLSDYKVTARTYIQTLCYPLVVYSDVEWRWSDDEGEGKRLHKVIGGGATTSSTKEKLGTKWEVAWSYEGGGGMVVVHQEPSPQVDIDQIRSDTNPTYILSVPGGRPVYRQTPFAIKRQTRRKPYTPGVDIRVRTCWGSELLVTGWDFVSEYEITTAFNPRWGQVGWYINGVPWGAYGGALLIPNYGCLRSFFWNTTTLSIFYEKDGAPFSVDEYLLEIYSGQEGIWSTNWTETYTEDPVITTVPPGGGNQYSITVTNMAGVEVAGDTSSSLISSEVTKIETKKVCFVVRNKDGEESLNKCRTVEVRQGESDPSASGEVKGVIPYITSYIEVCGEEVCKVTINGVEGQSIADSSVYEEAVKPISLPNGQTVYPCYPQKGKEPYTEGVREFTKEMGFNAYHLTRYETKKDGKDVNWEIFNFNDPDLSGQLPSPSINYLYSLISTDLLVSYDPVARLSWGADVPEENPETGETTNLEEEQIDGIDRNGVLYPLVKGFIYGLYGPIKASNTLLNQKIDKQAGQSLGNYDMTGWSYRNRARKPRTYVLGPDDFEEGEPFEEYDITDPNQRGLHQMQMTMGRTFRQSLWGYDLGPIGNEREEDWRHEAATKRVDIKVNMDDVKALLKATERKNVKFLVYPDSPPGDEGDLGSENESEPTTKTFKMNPIQDVFEGYGDVKILAVAGVIY